MSYDDTAKFRLQSAKFERNKTPALDAANGRESKGAFRTVVRFIGYRIQPLDPDNFAGGCKDLLDALRHAGLIHGDEAWRIVFQAEQIKVSHKHEEKTVVEIEYPEEATFPA
jgi:hypothetical protein